MDRRLIHYSTTPLTEVYSITQDGYGSGSYKPRGLWVSASGEDDWPAWCHSENFGVERLQNPVEVVLRPDAKILRISTPEGIDAFEREYVTRAAYPHEGAKEYRSESVNWKLVAERYQGIIISPYIWERRLTDTMWYYGWDCASGCIWDAKAISHLVPIMDEMAQAAE